jgi:hypothetical protein
MGGGLDTTLNERESERERERTHLLFVLVSQHLHLDAVPQLAPLERPQRPHRVRHQVRRPDRVRHRVQALPSRPAVESTSGQERFPAVKYGQQTACARPPPETSSFSSIACNSPAVESDFRVDLPSVELISGQERFQAATPLAWSKRIPTACICRPEPAESTCATARDGAVVGGEGARVLEREPERAPGRGGRWGWGGASPPTHIR